MTVYRALADNIILKAVIFPKSLGNHVTSFIGQHVAPRGVNLIFKSRVTEQPLLLIRVRHRPVYFNHNQLQQQRKT